LNTNIENQCSLEKLAEFKREINTVFVVVWESLIKFFPQVSEENRSFFIASFLAYIFGYYPLAYPTQKQIDATTLAEIEYRPWKGYSSLDFKDAFYRSLRLLLSDF
jgi:hypothetical protein